MQTRMLSAKHVGPEPTAGAMGAESVVAREPGIPTAAWKLHETMRTDRSPTLPADD